MVKLFNAVTTFVILAAVVGCAPDLGMQLSVPALPEPEQVERDEAGGPVLKLRVGNFIDARRSKTVAVIDGREVPSEGQLGALVQEGLGSYYRKAGVRVVLLNAPLIEGEILEWRATVTPGFPTSAASAKARLSVIVKGTDSTLLYKGSFSGDSSMAHPMLRASHVQGLLAQAILNAFFGVIRSK